MEGYVKDKFIINSELEIIYIQNGSIVYLL